jgi:hypothetical protein
MGKSDERQTRSKSACAQKATSGESKHKKQPSVDTLGSKSIFDTPFEDDDGGLLHSQWLHQFQHLCEYKVQFGNCLVPVKYAANPKLGRWVQAQRTRCRKSAAGDWSAMIPERLRALKGIGFDWGVSSADLASIWKVRFQELCEFKAQFGHCVVMKSYSANPRLGTWVATQHNQYSRKTQNKSNCMTDERIRELDGISFEWRTGKTDLGSIWSVQFEELREFKAQHGHCMVTKQYSTDPKLGNWVSRQRSNYKWYQEGKPSHMTADRIRELERIGFNWEPHCDSWNERFEQLCEYKAQFGHCRVPNNFHKHPKLGKWVSTQRTNYRLYQKGKPSDITAGRIREIDGIGFDWETTKTDLEAI